MTPQELPTLFIWRNRAVKMCVSENALMMSRPGNWLDFDFAPHRCEGYFAVAFFRITSAEKLDEERIKVRDTNGRTLILAGDPCDRTCRVEQVA